MRTQSIRKPTLAAVTVLAAVFVATSAFPQDTAEAGGERYYYADGERMPLTIATDYLAVRLEADADAAALLAPVAALVDAPSWRQTESFPRHGILLIRLPDEQTTEGRLESEHLLAARSEVRSVTPVFTVGEEKYLTILLDEFVVRFRPEVSAEEIAALNEQHGVEVVREDRYEANQFILRVTAASQVDALEAANLYHESALTLWAAPNFLSEVRKALTPSDAHYTDQWHLDNSGQAGGTAGEDVDAEDAWDLSIGNSTIVIAVIDDGVDYNHEDLSWNIFSNPGEIPGDGLDNDGNSYVDDVRGWDFYDGDNDPMPSTFNPPYDSSSVNDIHGTPCAGIAAARIDNGLGVAGIAGNSRILPIKIFGGTTSSNFTTESDLADAIRYAGTLADVLSNSWVRGSSTQISSAFQHVAVNGRGGRGCVILCASGNGGSSQVSYPARLTTVTAIGASTNQGVRAQYSQYGNDLDLLAPSSGGTMAITTTDVSIPNRGYDGLDTNGFYTNSFSRTSAATPLAAGVAALVLSMDPTLPKGDVQDILQDTAEQIDAANANYHPATGFSNEYGYGRVNARAAMQEARDRRLQGVDVYARDSGADVGDTPTARPWYRSPDIKVDAWGDQTVTGFDQVVHESAVSGQSNQVYVQVHNRGAVTADSVTVHLYWAFAGTGLPSLPEQFWNEYPSSPSDTTFIHPLGQEPITNLVPGTPQYVTFPWVAPALDPSLNDPEHHCLFAVIDSPQDPVFVRLHHIDTIVRNDNNIALHNVNVVELEAGDAGQLSFYAGNPFPYEIAVRLDYHSGAARELGWRIGFEGYDRGGILRLKPREQRLMRLSVTIPEAGQEGEITIVQTVADTGEPMGGIVYQLRSVEVVRPWSLSLHAGVAIPQGNARNVLDDGWNLIVDFDYRFTPQLSFVGMVGYNQFEEILGDDFYWFNLSGNLRYYYRRVGRAEYYLGGGPGIYVPERGDSKLGLNLGAGIDVGMTPRVRLELGGDYHRVFDSDMEFLHFHGGLVFSLP